MGDNITFCQNCEGAMWEDNICPICGAKQYQQGQLICPCCGSPDIVIYKGGTSVAFNPQINFICKNCLKEF